MPGSRKVRDIRNHSDKDLCYKCLMELTKGVPMHLRADLINDFYTSGIDDAKVCDGAELTLGQIGDILGGISRERVRQIEHMAFRKLKHPAVSKALKEYIHE